MTTPIKAYSLEGLAQLIEEAGLPRYRTQQIAHWLYKEGCSSYDDMVNVPASVRQQFAQLHPLYTPTIEECLVSVDGSRKYLLRLGDGFLIETVALPSRDNRLTVCCSSQVGCAMACVFCATGQAGFKRNLDPGEIVDQLFVVQRDFGRPVTNVVLMGQGEPFANYDSTLAALRIINHQRLLGIGARHITVSTCGLVRGIQRFGHEPEQFTLAVSLHSAQQDVRDYLMPRVSSTPLSRLKEVLGRYIEASTRRVSLEYALIHGVNDSDEALKALVSFCEGLLCHVNLIPLNDIEGPSLKPASPQTVSHWLEQLEDARVSTTVRHSMGSDIAGACGQLAGSK